MIKQSAIETLISNLQSEMSRVGGKLTGLSAAQIQLETRNNTIDGDYTPQNEGTKITMASNTARNIETENNKPEIAPAGGPHDQEIANAVFAFMSQASGLQKQAPRSWKEKALDQAVPAATTVVSVLAAYGVIALVERQVAKRQAKKQLAAANAEQLLSVGEQNVA